MLLREKFTRATAEELTPLQLETLVGGTILLGS